MKKEITQGLFRMSAILYARNNSNNISQKQIIRKIIEDALFQHASDKSVLLSKLVEFIMSNYAITLSAEEVIAVIKDNKFSDNFDYYEDDGFRVSLKHKRRVTIQQENSNNKNLNDYIIDFINTNNFDNSKTEVIFRFLYGIFTTNLEGYKHLLKEKNIIKVDDVSFNDEDKIIINKFLDWDDVGKNAAIFNLASFALEYCMLTNKKDALFELDNLKNKNLYIDSNIIFRSLGVNGEDRKIRTEQFLSKFGNVNQNLFITKETDTEIRETIDYYISKLNKAKTPAVNSKVFVEVVDIDGFYKFYHKWKINRTDGSVGSFKIHLLAKYEEVLNRFKIQKDSIKPFKDEDVKDLLKDYESQILNQNEEKSYSAASVDAKNIIWMEHKRNGQNDDIYKTKYFFVSSDQHLRRWDFNRNANEVPIVMLPSQWLSMILRYMERTDDDYKSFVCFLNMKINHPSMSEEQLLYAIEGISEITSDITQQNHLIKSFIKEDFNNELQSLTNEELQEKAKAFAETEFDKQLKQLESDNDNKNKRIENLEQESFQKNKTLEKNSRRNKRQHLVNKRLSSENKKQKKEINKLRKEKRDEYIAKQIKKWRWKTWWWIIGVGIIVLPILIVAIWFHFNKPESDMFIIKLANNPIVKYCCTFIGTIIEIFLIYNIRDKYDISKIKEFKEQVIIPEDLTELK